MDQVEQHEWLAIAQAANILGVHPSTLRRWADEGQIPFMLTPGGHRRFSEQDIHSLGTSRRRLKALEDIGDEFGEQALTHTRNEITIQHDAAWLQAYDDSQKVEKRQSGKRLLGLMLRYVSAESAEERYLDQAIEIGREYGVDARAAGISLRSALEATMFFRDTILESTLDLPKSVHMNVDMNVELVGRINHLLNAIQLAIVEAYEDSREGRHAS